jgi:hypothetical protein
MTAKRRWYAMVLISLALTAAGAWLSYLAADMRTPLLQVELHQVFVFKSCAAVAVLYFFATLVRAQLLWGVVAGLGAGIGAGLFMDMLEPKGHVFTPFIDSAFHGTVAGDVTWIVINMVLCFAIAWVALKRVFTSPGT